MKYDSICETGSVREINQDSIFLDVLEEYGVFCVADGTGDHGNGRLASQAIVSLVKAGWESMRKDLTDSGFEYVFARLRETIELANIKIFEDLNTNSTCGSTVVLLLLFENRYGIISVGDSRLYHCYKDDVRLLTGEEYGKPTKSVGESRSIILNTIQGEFSRNSSFLLCSDGIQISMPENALRYAIKTWGKHPHKLVNMLKEKVILSGARDNYSAIAISVRGIL